MRHVHNLLAIFDFPKLHLYTGDNCLNAKNELIKKFNAEVYGYGRTFIECGHDMDKLDMMGYVKLICYQIEIGCKLWLCSQKDNGTHSVRKYLITNQGNAKACDCTPEESEKIASRYKESDFMLEAKVNAYKSIDMHPEYMCGTEDEAIAPDTKLCADIFQKTLLSHLHDHVNLYNRLITPSGIAVFTQTLPQD